MHQEDDMRDLAAALDEDDELSSDFADVHPNAAHNALVDQVEAAITKSLGQMTQGTQANSPQLDRLVRIRTMRALERIAAAVEGIRRFEPFGGAVERPEEA